MSFLKRLLTVEQNPSFGIATFTLADMGGFNLITRKPSSAVDELSPSDYNVRRY